MPLINCEINLILTWSLNGIIFNAAANQETEFAVTHTKLYVPVVTLSVQDNAKLLKPLKSGFERRNNWNKHQSKITTKAPNQYLDSLIDPSFQEVNRLFVLTYNNNASREGHARSNLLCFNIISVQNG